MFKIATLNKISSLGLDRFKPAYEIIEGMETPVGVSGVLVRSANMLEMDFDRELLAIARAGAGVNNIPLDKCADRGVVVFNTPGANANAVKELVIASLILAARNMDSGIAWVNQVAQDPATEDISKAVEKGKSQFAGNEISGKTLGVVGLGAIGAMVANTAVALGMKVIGYDPYLTPAAAARLTAEVQTMDKLEDLLPLADFVTLHLPAVDSTKGMVNSDLLSHFKKGSILLNFSRDKLVEEDAIIAALDNGTLKKYITDFITAGIAGRPNVTCMPHLGASTEEAEDNCAIMAVDEIMDYIESGIIRNSVNFPNTKLKGDDEGEVWEGNRIAILTKGEPDPVKLALSMFADKEILDSAGGVRGDYGYALLHTKDKIESVPKVEGVTKVRIMGR